MPKTEDLAAVRAVLETDRAWAAFALADLAPKYSRHSEWHLANGEPAVALVYRAFQPPVLFALGAAHSVKPLIQEIAGEPALHLAVRADVFDLVLNGAR